MRKSKKFQQTTGFGLPDDGAWEKSYMRLPATVAEEGGVPIRAFGRVFVHGVSPDFQTHVVLQQGNPNQQKKIWPKKSWEISDNYIGSMVSYHPRIPQNDFQPLLAIHLIDGNSNTAWGSRGDGRPDLTPAWARIDLPGEEKLQEIVLLPRRDEHPWPGELTIKISQDAWHWTTVYESGGIAPPKGKPVRIKLSEPTPAKQIWAIGTQLSLDPYGDGDYTFSFAELQAIDEKGENVALSSRGAGVTVSSTNYGFGGDWIYNDQMWPTQYDMGAKWIRLSGGNPPFHQDTLQWRFVEQEKSKYVIDERTLQALAEATSHGCEVVVMMTYGNFLYTSNPEKQILDPRKFPAEFPPAPLTRKGVKGYLNWVRAMAKAYKGAVTYWEIWNEPAYWGWEIVEDFKERVKVYCDLVKACIPVIKEVDPKAKVSLGGMGGIPGKEFNGDGPDWLRDCVAQEIAPLVDAFQWHIQGAVLPELPGWKIYPKAVSDFQQEVEAQGFKGVYMASEYWLAAPYPPHANWAHPPHAQLPGLGPITEIRKAKDTARVFAMNIGLNVIPYWCNTWWEGPRDCGIFRITWGADPINPEQPQPTYYAIRTLGTALEGARPAELKVELSDKTNEFDNYNFSIRNGGYIVGLWLPSPSVDKHPGVTTDVIATAGKCSKVIGIDTLNGFEQELKFEQQGDKVVIPGIVVRDYPLLLRLER